MVLEPTLNFFHLTGSGMLTFVIKLTLPHFTLYKDTNIYIYKEISEKTETQLRILTAV